MRINLKSKILILFFSIITVVIFGLYLYLNTTLVQIVFNNIKSQIHQETQFAENFLNARLLASRGKVNLDDIADEIGHDLKLRATIIDINGVVVGDSTLTQDQLTGLENHLTRPEIVSAMRNGSGEAKRYSSTINEDSFYYALPVRENPYFEGVLRTSVKLSAIAEISGKLKQILTVALLTALILVFVFGYAATVRISRPITDISNMAKEIAQGQYAHRAMVDSNDEIGDLSRAINHMSVQISQRMDEVSKSRSRLEAVFLNMFDGIMIVDAKGQIRLINDMLKSFISFTEDPVGKKPLQAIRNLDIQRIVDSILTGQEKFIREEVHVHTKEEKILLVHATTIERDNIKDGAALVFHDITEMRRLETMRKDFVANVSHELRTPITSIRGYAETLSDGALEDKKAAVEFLNIIKIDAERLSKLVDDILDLSRIESGKMELRIENVDINKMVDRVLQILSPKINEQSITVNVDIDSGITIIPCDGLSIEQVLINLVNNAVKYNKQGGQITIKVEQDTSKYTFHIIDTGIGIPAEDLPRIFEKFYRVDKARSRDLGGTGLGLSIVKHYIQAHFGKVSVQSQFNKGTTFSFTIPKV